MAPKTEPGGNPQKLETLFKNLNRLVRSRPKPLNGIGENRQSQQHNGQNKGVPPEALKWATETEQQQRREEGLGDVEERLPEVAVMHQEHVVEAKPKGEATSTERELAVQDPRIG